MHKGIEMLRRVKMDHNININKEIMYAFDADVKAQGCQNDCKVVTYTNTKSESGADPIPPVGGPAVTPILPCRSKKKTEYTAETCPFW